LQGLLVDTQLHPVAGQTIRLEFDPGCDNPDCILNPMELDRTVTGIDGSFQFEIPLFSDTDPMFQLRRYGTNFSLTTDVGTLRSPDTASQKAAVGWFKFAAQPFYTARMTVMRVVPARISVKLGPSFLKQNKLSENLKSNLKGGVSSVDLELEIDGVAGPLVRLSEGGRFGISVLPGTYGLILHVVRGKTSTDIRIAEGIVIAEGQETVIEIR